MILVYLHCTAVAAATLHCAGCVWVVPGCHPGAGLGLLPPNTVLGVRLGGWLAWKLVW